IEVVISLALVVTFPTPVVTKKNICAINKNKNILLILLLLKITLIFLLNLSLKLESTRNTK
ncbi:hypothetical protein C4B91_26195, partial [Salmonella enterica subsp. enterica serovar Waycross]|nr:hypothetical protein [Salmonella enterica subsp. enterica serovar Waycross]